MILNIKTKNVKPKSISINYLLSINKYTISKLSIPVAFRMSEGFSDVLHCRGHDLFKLAVCFFDILDVQWCEENRGEFYKAGLLAAKKKKKKAAEPQTVSIFKFHWEHLFYEGLRG